MAKKYLFSYIALFLLILSGCGGGGGTGVVPLPVAKNNALILSATLKPGLTNTSAAIKGIDVSFVLPAKASPILNADGSLQISETGLKNLSTQGNIPLGSYNQGTRTINFILWPNDVATSDLGIGDIARITYTTASGAALTSQELEQIRLSLSYLVSGPGSVDISSEIVPSANLVTYQKP